MTSIEAPRPLNLGEILDRTVQHYRDRFLVYLGIAIIPTGVLLILAGSVFLAVAWLGARARTHGAGHVNSPGAIAIGFVVLAAVSLLVLAAAVGVSSLSAAAMNHAAAGALAGRRPTIRGSYAEAWRRGWMYVWLYILQSLIVWVAPLAVWFGAFMLLTTLLAGGGRGAGAQAAGALVGLSTIFGLTAVAGYALWMLLCVSLAFPGCIVEKISAWKALRRSFRLSKGTRGRIFVLYLLGYALGMIVSMVAFVILVIAVALIPALNTPQNSQKLGMAVLFLFYGGSYAVKAFTKPIYAIALMLFYYDQRIRNEGFDIEWMMERAGLRAGEAVASSGGSSAVLSGDPVAGPNEAPMAAPNGEFSPASGNEYVAVPVEMESASASQSSGAVHAHNTGQAVEQAEAPGAAEAKEATEPAETKPPENGVQG
jgi:hypothetical protein